MAVSAVVLPIRGIQLLFAIIVLGLTAYLESVTIDDGFFTYNFQPSELNFMLFNAVWTLLVVAFILVATMRFTALAHPFLLLAIDAVTMIFWFAGFIALAVIVKDWQYVASDTQYHTAQAAAAFGAFEWLLFLAATVLDVMDGFGGGRFSTKTEHPTSTV